MSPGGGSGDFVSPTAIELLWPHLAGRLGARPALATVGAASTAPAGRTEPAAGVAPARAQRRRRAGGAAGTGRALARSTHCPGEGQRRAQPALAAQLSERGAEVTMLDVYRRQPASPDWHHVDAALAGPGVDAVALTSSEAVDWLFMLGGESRRATLQSLLYVAPHRALPSAWPNAAPRAV